MFLFQDSGADADARLLFDAAAGRWWRALEVQEAVSALAAALDGPRRVAFLFCRNSVPAVVGYLALLEAGHAVALLDGGMSPAFKRRLVDLYRPELVLAAPDDFHEEGEPALLVRDPAEHAGLAVWRRTGGEGAPPHPDLAVMLSTSGSTGSPKLVRLTRGNIEANARSIVASLGLVPGERPVSSLPISYSYGLSVINSHLLVGASVVLTSEGVLSRTFWDLVRAERCTSFAGVPYTYQMLARIGFERMDLPSLTTMTQAGGKLNEAMVSRFHAHMTARGGRFFVMYGATEATARMACLPAGDLPRKLGSAGLAIPGGHFEIEGPTGPTSAPDVTGEVVYTGPNVMMGYATCREDLALGDVNGGCLRTGDVGHLDGEGYLFITGRTKRISKLFGMRINLDEVEAMVRRYGAAAVVGSDEKIVAFCEFGDAAELQRCRLDIAAAMKINHSALELRRVAALPLTGNGKIDYTRLQNEA